MKRRKFSPPQKLKILQEAESEGMLATCRKHKIAQNEDRDKYLKLKMELAKMDWVDGNQYADAKSEFIKGIEEKIIENK